MSTRAVVLSAPPPQVRSNGSRGPAKALAAAAAGAAALVSALFLVTPLDGGFGFLLCWYGAFATAYGLLTRRREGPLVARDRLATVLIVSAGLVAFLPLVLILGFVVSKGIGALRPGFFTHSLSAVGPLDPATAGGALHALVGTAEQVGVATLVSVPLGILTALHLYEHRGRLASVVRFFVDAMSGIPSIVAGLFVFSVWVIELDRGFSGVAAGLALAVLMLPTVTRTSEEMLRLVPSSLREAALALGAPEWRVALRIVLPAARSGLITAVMLGVARVVGETAPLILTAFGSDSLNTNVGSEPQSALPLFVYQQIRNPGAAQIARAWTGALVLVLAVLILFSIARAAGGGRREVSR